MAAETQRAPRMARGLTSMAAAVAASRAASDDGCTDTDMVAAWVAVFQAAAGLLIVDSVGRQSIAFTHHFEPVSEVIGSTVLTLASRDERLGAIKALRAVLDLCGRDTRDEVFSFAAVVAGGR